LDHTGPVTGLLHLCIDYITLNGFIEKIVIIIIIIIIIYI